MDKKSITEEIDETIIEVCRKIQKNNISHEHYGGTVMAHAALIEAREKLH